MIVTLLAASFSLNLAIAEDTKAISGTDGASVKKTSPSVSTVKPLNTEKQMLSETKQQLDQQPKVTQPGTSPKAFWEGGPWGGEPGKK